MLFTMATSYEDRFISFGTGVVRFSLQGPLSVAVAQKRHIRLEEPAAECPLGIRFRDGGIDDHRVRDTGFFFCFDERFQLPEIGRAHV